MIKPNSRIKLFFFLLESIIFILSLTACSGPENAAAFEQPIIWLNQNNQHPFKFANKITLLVFLTEECEGCGQLSPVIKKIAQQYQNQIEILGVFTPKLNRNFSASAARLYVINQLEITYPVIFDQKANILKNYHINGWPTLLLVNKKAEIKERIYGVKSFDYFNHLMQEIIAGEKT